MAALAGYVATKRTIFQVSEMEVKKVSVKKKTTTVVRKKKRAKVKDLDTSGKNVKGGIQDSEDRWKR